VERSRVTLSPGPSIARKTYLEDRRLPGDLETTRHRSLSSGRAASRGELTDVSQRYSPDVATLLFLETVSALPANRVMRERFESELAYVRRVGAERAKPNVPDDLLVLLVPGWFYLVNGVRVRRGRNACRHRRTLWPFIGARRDESIAFTRASTCHATCYLGTRQRSIDANNRVMADLAGDRSRRLTIGTALCRIRCVRGSYPQRLWTRKPQSEDRGVNGFTFATRAGPASHNSIGSDHE